MPEYHDFVTRNNWCLVAEFTRSREIQPKPAQMTQIRFKLVGSERSGRCITICDHATNFVPDEISGGNLGLADGDIDRHIAFDIGTAALGEMLAKHLDGPALASGFSRLVIDPNRGEDDPTLVRRIYDGSIIPANRSADQAEIERRIKSYYRPYHSAINSVIDSAIVNRTNPIIVSVHSFTPQLNRAAIRPWHIGILSSVDRRIADPLIAELSKDPDLCIGDNEPYVGSFPGDTMERHAHPRNIPHVVLEFRSDLIDTEPGQLMWAKKMATSLKTAIAAANI
jgi:predicted N-formylglutamate amidohydrolase